MRRWLVPLAVALMAAGIATIAVFALCSPHVQQDTHRVNTVSPAVEQAAFVAYNTATPEEWRRWCAAVESMGAAEAERVWVYDADFTHPDPKLVFREMLRSYC